MINMAPRNLMYHRIKNVIRFANLKNVCFFILF